MGELRHADRFVMVTVRLSRGQCRRLDEMAGRLGQTRTDLIREAIQGYLPVLRKDADAVKERRSEYKVTDEEVD